MALTRLAGRHLVPFLRMPPRVGRFYLRALRAARAAGDSWMLVSVTRPGDLSPMLRMAGEGTTVAEIGTGSGITAIAMALAHPARHVSTCDVIERENRDRYLALVPEEVRRRVHMRTAGGEDGPGELRDIDLLFIDSSHEREETLATFRAWEPRVRPGGTVAFHDYDDPRYPGVVEAIRELGLEGEGRTSSYAWRKPDGEPRSQAPPAPG